ncbi:hypothetical protein [Calothrix sp. UHCC 0171]|nr:hypothetical protein [Calothrix sp. UHCC 0171]MEA5569699.1 hypothetical protein [Calothrix sp. UHCC 0171]
MPTFRSLTDATVIDVRISNSRTVLPLCVYPQGSTQRTKLHVPA